MDLLNLHGPHWDFRFFVLSLLLSLFTQPSLAAKPINISKLDTFIDLENHIDLLINYSKDKTENRITLPPKDDRYFINVPLSSLTKNRGASWGRLRIANPYNNKQVILSTKIVDGVILNLYRAQGIVLLPIVKRTNHTGAFYDLEINGKEINEFYIEAISTKPSSLSISAINADQFYYSKYSTQLILEVFFGILLLTLFFNVHQNPIQKTKSRIWFNFYVLSILITNCYSYNLVPVNNIYYIIQIGIILSSVSSIAGLVFIRFILNLDSQKNLVLRSAISILAAIHCFTIILSGFINDVRLLNFYNLALFIHIFGILLIEISAYFKNRPIANILIISRLPITILGILFFMTSTILPEDESLKSLYIVFASVFETLLLTIFFFHRKNHQSRAN